MNNECSYFSTFEVMIFLYSHVTIRSFSLQFFRILVTTLNLFKRGGACSSATTNRRILLHAAVPTLAHVQALPTKDEVAEVRADEYTDDEVPIVVHG